MEPKAIAFTCFMKGHPVGSNLVACFDIEILVGDALLHREDDVHQEPELLKQR